MLEHTHAVRMLSRELGYRPSASIQQLQHALTHKSYANENVGDDVVDNERLEFLGDSVVGLVVGEALMQRHPGAAEGDLSKMRAGLVCTKNLAGAACKLGLGDLLRLGRGEVATGGANKDNIIADAFEAVIGAVYLDLGLATARNAILAQLGDQLRDSTLVVHRDYKTELQEIVQTRFAGLPVYGPARWTGPDHDRTFTVQVAAGAHLAIGVGRSKKAAEQDAARGLLAELSVSR